MVRRTFFVSMVRGTFHLIKHLIDFFKMLFLNQFTIFADSDSKTISSGTVLAKPDEMLSSTKLRGNFYDMEYIIY